MEARTLTDVVVQLLILLDLTDKAEVGDAEVNAWPEGALTHLAKMGLLQQIANATQVLCHGCEEGCVVSPRLRRRPAGEPVFVHPCHVRDYGYIYFEAGQLQRWRLDVSALATWIAGELGLDGKVQAIHASHLWRLGEVRLKRERRPVYLTWGLAGAQATDRAATVSQHLLGERPILIVPTERPSVLTWPEPPKDLLTLTDLLRSEDGHLGLALDQLTGALGRLPAAVRPFPIPHGTRWEQVILRVVDDETVEIQVGARRERRTYIEMGMADTRRRPPVADEAWGLLLAFAQHGEAITWQDAIADEDLRITMRLLRAKLRAYFSIDSNPFHSYEKRSGWRARFTLTDLRR